MQHVLYLLLRRLRTPIITLIVVYAISMLGFTLIPGEDPDGNIWYMDFFHAFYFVSFMGTTIGFGEIPYVFTPMQRGWATISIYGTVLTWLYAIGNIFSLFGDSSFRRLVTRNSFDRRVRRIHEPYYLVCGCGVTGKRIIRLLDDHGIRTVVIERDQTLFDQFEADEASLSTPGICADAADPDVLNIAGIQNPLCAGVLAITNDDHTNLSIAIDSKLVMPERLVISATQTKETAANLHSFGTDYIVDPFEVFADQFYLSLHQPYKYLLHDLIVNPNHKVWASPYQKTVGRWVICGYGRFGKALERKFLEHGIEMTFIEPYPVRTGAPHNCVEGIGTEAHTLIAAGIEDAVGIVAGTPDDADNLSIIITARNLNKDLITVARQSHDSNKPMFRAADVNMIMQPGRGVANEIFMLIRTPLLSLFFHAIQSCDRNWSRALFLRITEVIEEHPLDTTTFIIDRENAPAVTDFIRAGRKIRLSAIYRDPRNRDDLLPTVPVFLKRGDQEMIDLSGTLELEIGDQVLFCGRRVGHRYIDWTINNHSALRYVISGRHEPDGWIWRYVGKKRRARLREKKRQALKDANQ